VAFLATRRYRDDADPRRAWAIGILASLCGLALGVFFLSFSSNHVLWLFLGIAGAYYGVLRDADPDLDVAWRQRDFGIVGSISLGVLMALFVYTRMAL
jgi:hypothetical protein